MDLIKFDLRFLDGAGSDGQAGQIILKKSVQLIEELGLSCVVEGVETKEQVQLLQAIGCNKAQGYYFSRPVPVEEFEFSREAYIIRGFVVSFRIRRHLIKISI